MLRRIVVKGEGSKVDGASYMSLLRRRRTKLVLLFNFSTASPRNDGASIGGLGFACRPR